MAEKRMFANTIIDSDIFMDMPLSTQALYFHLSMKADDDGFVCNPKRIQRTIGCCDDDMRLLKVKNFIIPFDSGIVVIKHWRINNYIRSDRYKPTIFLREKSLISMDRNNTYEIGIPAVYQTDTQYRVEKISEEENSIVECKVALGNEIITHDMYNSLLKKYEQSIVDDVIGRIIAHPYYGCLNERTISKWCDEAMRFAKSKRAKRNNGLGGQQREYDYDKLERELLANKGSEDSSDECK